MAKSTLRDDTFSGWFMYVFVDDGYPESCDFENNYVWRNPARPEPAAARREFIRLPLPAATVTSRPAAPQLAEVVTLED